MKHLTEAEIAAQRDRFKERPWKYPMKWIIDFEARAEAERQVREIMRIVDDFDRLSPANFEAKHGVNAEDDGLGALIRAAILKESNDERREDEPQADTQADLLRLRDRALEGLMAALMAMVDADHDAHTRAVALRVAKESALMALADGQVPDIEAIVTRVMEEE